VVVFSILLSWGKNFMFLTDLFLDYFPGYNKFRTVSMILVMAELAIPLLAILALDKLISGEFTKKEFFRAFRYSLYIAGGIALLYTLFPAISDLSSPKDEILKEQGARDLVNVILEDRADLLRKDAFRSLLFVLLGAGLVFAYYSKKIKNPAFYVLLGLLILADLWPVNKRYLNDDNFVPERTAQNPFQATPADLEILKDQELYFRVFDLTQGDPFASSRASWFHKSIGGYHGAKMRRYQELYDHHIRESMDPEVLDMLNTKYLITRDQASGQTQAVRRNTNLGNAWFVAGVELVKNADEEIDKLGSIDPSALALVDIRFSDKLEGVIFRPDSTSTIRLVSYSPDRLEYEYSTSSTQVAVFSEIYYPKGWNAFINGKENFHFRVNYTLRGMMVEPGEGSIVFEFKPDSYYKGSKIAFAGSVLLVLLVIGGIFYGFKYRVRSQK
jgi:hypothetical protein